MIRFFFYLEFSFKQWIYTKIVQILALSSKMTEPWGGGCEGSTATCFTEIYIGKNFQNLLV